ncbi:MAG: DNA mismatch repair endonuclease MutL [Rickettsiales bacterium]|jgi:DNA mismatch repair protein MutL|nr:DNA mismatch repair endonuclease MutL [Rickettsiales bacterium]
MPIRVLPQNLVNQIAAGEVVERPASAVKEIIENSIDAGATKIEILARDGGKSRITVTDNGRGMGRRDLELSVVRYATSKLLSDDLSSISFLGFRGEALPSIASVSRMSIISNDGSECWEMKTEGGNALGARPASLPRGTKVEVADLFFNIPARQAFLGSDRSEMSAIIDAVERIALCYPDIEFRLNDSTHFPAGTREERTAQVLGRKFMESAIAVNADVHGMKIQGFVSRPTENKGTSMSQYFYVNGRALKDRLLSGALRGAYSDVIEKGRHPVSALWITVPPGDIDVNAHPQKAEIRFKEPAYARGAIISAVRPAIANARVAPVAAELPRISTESARPAQEAPRPLAVHETDFGFERSINPATVDTAPAGEEAALYPLGLARGLVANKYIIAECADGMVMADFHACHERIIYEKIKSGNMARQMLLLPESVEIGERALLNLADKFSELAEMGLVMEESGKGSVTVLEVPADLDAHSAESLVLDIAEDVDSPELEERIARVAKTISCHNSLRAGASLTIDQMNALLRQVESSPNAGQCNHGRRSFVKWSMKDLDKLFDR